MIRNRSRSGNDDFGRILRVAGGKYFNRAWIELAEGRITARHAAERPVCVVLALQSVKRLGYGQ